MSDFWLYFNIGLTHVLDVKGYDHVLFLMALAAPYAFKNWRNLLVLLTLFTIGHTMSLVLSVYGIVTLKSNIIEFLIPLTILAAAIYNFSKARKSSARNESITVAALGTLFFGVIHGLGFSNYFKVIISANSKEKFAPLMEFALGIEAAQIIVVLAVLIVSFIAQNFFRVSKRDWILVLSSFIAGVVIPMIIDNEIW